MTISTESRKAGPFDGNGVTVDFPFSFKVFSTSDVLVVHADSSDAETILDITDDYTVTLNADQNSHPGGTVTLLTAPATGEKVTLSSAIAILQPLELTSSGGFSPTVLNAAFDRLTIICQQIAEESSRAIKVTLSSDLTPDEFVAELQLGASQASASAAAAAASAALAATFEPDNYILSAGDTMTGDFTIATGGTLTAEDAIDAQGGVTVPANETGNNAPRSSEVVKVATAGAGAKIHSWTTAGRPTLGATDQAIGYNSTTGKMEFWNGTEWVVVAGLDVAPVSLSGTSMDFTGVPAWTKSGIAHLDGYSLSGSSRVLIQIGTASGIVATGYSGGRFFSSSGGTSEAAATNGLASSISTSSIITNLRVTFDLMNATTNRWMLTADGTTTTGAKVAASATITLTDPLTQVRIRSENGTDTFDAGSISFKWRP